MKDRDLRDLLHFVNTVKTAISSLLQDDSISKDKATETIANNLLIGAEQLQKKYGQYNDK